MNKLKVLDLFSGIGMFSYGLHKTDLYETVAFCEWDKSCQDVLRKNFRDVEIFGDVSDLEGSSGRVRFCYERNPARGGIYDLYIERSVEVIVGGFPCQDISNSGKMKGIDGPRSGYWKEFNRLISQIKPKGVIIENVAALKSRGLNRVLSDLSSVGYDAEWHCIPASYLGAIHKRDRIWIIAYPSSFGRKDGLQMVKTLGEGKTPVIHSESHLYEIVNNPFGRSGGLPKPLIRRGDVEYSRRVDRLKQIGNTVYWPIVEQLGYHLHRNIA